MQSLHAYYVWCDYVCVLGALSTDIKLYAKRNMKRGVLKVRPFLCCMPVLEGSLYFS